MKYILLPVLVLALIAGGYYAWQQRPTPDFGRKVLVFSKTDEYRHESIPTGIATITSMGRREGFNVVATEDAGHFNDVSLSQYRAVVFLNTTGDVLDAEQQVAFERYIQAGGGFVGIHSAADTEWREDPWYWYQRLVGGVFRSHPLDSDQPATLTVTSGVHPATTDLPMTWTASDEWYDFQRVTDDIEVLVRVDESTYSGGTMGDHHPIAWYRDFDGGRSIYIGLGHTESTYENPEFLALLRGGLEYAMGERSADGGYPALDYSRSRPESWRFSRTVLDSALDEPVKLAFNPAGDLYFIQRKGELMRYDFERGESVEVARLEVFTENESGLLGLAFAPDFDVSQWLYLYRSTPREDPEKAGETVLSRFKLRDGTLDQASEQVLLRMMAANNEATRASHTGGDMQFDSTGNLWLSTGDDTKAGDHGHIDDRPGFSHADAARSAANTQDLRGKILRIRPRETADAQGRYYDIPPGNLFEDTENGRPEIYVMGVRNPYTIAFDDREQLLYWGEVGPDSREDDERGPQGFDEINRTGKPGNFGWPYVIADNRAYSYYDYAEDQVLDKVDPEAPQNSSRNNTGARVLPRARPAWLYYPYAESE